MNAQRVADYLKKQGFDVKSVSEPNDVEDGSLVITDQVHVQIPLYQDYGPGVVRETAAGTFEFMEGRDQLGDIVADLHLAMLREQAEKPYDGSIQQFNAYMQGLANFLKSKPDHTVAAFDGNFVVLHEGSIFGGSQLSDGSYEYESVVDLDSSAWEESWKSQIDTWLQDPQFVLMSQDNIEALAGNFSSPKA